VDSRPTPSSTTIPAEGAAAAPPPDPNPPLETAKWYRLTLSTSASLPQTPAPLDALKTNLQASGFYAQAWLPANLDTAHGGARLAVIGHYEGLPGALARVPSWTLESTESVAAPSDRAARTVVPASLDGSLTIPSGKAVEIALQYETDPKALLEFAGVLLPEQPASAALLRTHATMLALKPAAAPPPGKHKHHGFFHFAEDLEKAAGHLSKDVAKVVTDASDAASHSVGALIEKLPEPMKSAWTVCTDPVLLGPKLFAVACKSGNLFENVKEFAKAEIHAYTVIAPYVETGISFFPGVGPEIAGSIAFAAAIAQGEPPSEAAVAALASALPGGAIVQTACKSAVAFGTALAEKKPLDVAALSAAREGLTALPGGEEVQKAATAAFDVGLAVAHGRSLAVAGFAAAKDLCPGGLPEQAVAFAAAVTTGGETPDLEKRVAAEVSASGPAPSQAVQGAVAALVSDPKIAQNADTSADLAKALGVPEPVARAARACVSSAAHGPTDILVGGVLVRTGRLEALAPGADQKTQVSASALAYATQRGSAALAADIASLESQKTAKASARAAELAQAARVLRRAELVRYYLSVGTAKAGEQRGKVA
jgi:hypothetical protein